VTYLTAIGRGLAVVPCKGNREEKDKQIMSEDTFHPSRRKFMAVSSAALLAPMVLNATEKAPAAKDAASKTPAHKASLTGKVYFITDKCIGCHLCKVNCPQKAIFYGDRRMSIDQEKCVHCGLCYTECPICVISEVDV
jgi:Fe-S-cluster-containing hydrogenase component 2